MQSISSLIESAQTRKENAASGRDLWSARGVALLLFGLGIAMSMPASADAQTSPPAAQVETNGTTADETGPTRPLSLSAEAGGAASGPDSVTGFANPSVKAAVEFTRDLTDRANLAFTATEDAEQQILAFQKVLNEGLALDILGRFMLGESRNSLTPEQQARYDEVFPRYITRLYADQFKDIAGRDLTINDATPFGRRDVIVRTQFFKDDGSPVNVDWRARKFRDEDHKMIDIIVSGVSIMTVKREEFSSFIETNGIDALIDRLESEAVEA